MNFKLYNMKPKLPMIFIIGSPCSSTTLMSQVLSKALDVGYITNFMARFWENPALGALLQRWISGVNPGAFINEYLSETGRTSGLFQPHEFGYFWDRWFSQGQGVHMLDKAALDKVPVEKLKVELSILECVIKKPLLFKNNTWHTMQVKYLAKHFPKAIFVACYRDLIYNAQSIAIARKLREGSIHKWWSIRPPNYEELLRKEWYEQIVGQVIAINSEMNIQLSKVEPHRVLKVNYEPFCKNPNKIIEDLVIKINKIGYDIPFENVIGNDLRASNYMRLSAEEFTELKQYCSTIL